MAKWLTNINLNQNQLQNALIHPLGSAPTGSAGQMYYNTGSGKMFYYNGSTWVEFGTGTGSILNAFNTLTDGTNNAVASGDDTFKFRSANNLLTLLVTNDDVTHGDNLLLTVNESNINHDALSGFVSNEHIDHSTVTLTVNGTANEIEVTGAGGNLTANRTWTIGLPNDVTISNNLTVGNDLTVTGNLTVNGTTTTVNTATLSVEDPLIKLGNNNAADTVDLGIYWQYNDGTPKYGGIARDASDANKAITFWTGEVTEPTTTSGFTTLADVKFGTVRSGVWNGTAITDTYISSAATWNAKQDGDATLTALATLNTTAGLVVQTGTDVFTKRTLTGTTNRITVTNGSGASGNPTVDIASTYVGQATITTLGTITSGTWNGSVIAAAYLDTTLAKKYSTTVGDGAATSIAVTHNFGTRNVLVEVFTTASPYDTVYCEVERNTTNQVTLLFATAPSAAQYTVVVTG